jgi:hypothetical protein
MRTKPQHIATLIIGGIFGLVLAGQALLPIIATNAEIKRWEAAEEMVERRRYQQTVMEAELAEKARQAEQTVATWATVKRVMMWGLGIGVAFAMVGVGFWGGKTLVRRALELPPTKRVEDGLILAGNAMYDRYSGMQTRVGIPQQPSLEHAQAYAIAKGAGREHWARLGYMALSALPAAIAALRDNGIDTPQEAMRVMDALPVQEGNNVGR